MSPFDGFFAATWLRFSRYPLYNSMLVLGAPLSVKLACKSWQQVSSIYARDLNRGAFFLRTRKPPAKGTAIRLTLVLPSGTSIQLRGQIQAIYDEGEFDGRGPGIDISLEPVPQSIIWLLESALSSAGLTPAKGTASPPPPTAAELPAVPSLEDGDEWITAESDLVQALWQELTTMSKMNPFQLLGLPTTSTESEIRSAFGTLSKKYHPDRFARYESFEIRELANEVFMLLRDAYRDVVDAASRNKLLEKLNPTPIRGEPPPRERRAQDSPTASPGGSVEVKSVSSVAQDNGGASAGRLAAALEILDTGDFKAALRMLQLEARKGSSSTEAKAAVEVAEGKIALESGDRMEAAQRFETALDIDPSNERAAQEIAEMRRQATSKRRGLLTKLMKKS